MVNNLLRVCELFGVHFAHGLEEWTAEPFLDLRLVLKPEVSGKRCMSNSNHRESQRDVVANEDVHLHDSCSRGREFERS